MGGVGGLWEPACSWSAPPQIEVNPTTPDTPTHPDWHHSERMVYAKDIGNHGTAAIQSNHLPGMRREASARCAVLPQLL